MMVKMNLQGVMITVMMNKHHYLYMDEGDLEVAPDLKAHPEVTVVALEGEAMVTVERQYDKWHKREPDTCTYMYNKTPGSTVPILNGITSL